MSDFERARKIRELGGEVGQEVVHLASWHGDVCERCGARISGPFAPKWREGDHVVLVSGDPNTAWASGRRVSCPQKS